MGEGLDHLASTSPAGRPALPGEIAEAVGVHGCRENPRPWMASRKPIWVDLFVLYYNL